VDMLGFLDVTIIKKKLPKELNGHINFILIKGYVTRNRCLKDPRCREVQTEL